MKRWSTSSQILVTVVIVSIVISSGVLICANTALAKSYNVSNLHIKANVNSDGSMGVTEIRTFDFKGDFSWVIQDIALAGSSGISDIYISEDGQPYALADSGPGTYSYKQIGDKIEVVWRFSAVNEPRTFTISYKVSGAVVSHLDVAELYWNFIGNEWEVSSSNVNVELNLPKSASASAEEIKAWGHGPLSGEVKILSSDKITWSIPHLPARTFLTGRVTFPNELVPQATQTSNREVLTSILAEEEAKAAKANRARMINLAVVIISPVLFMLCIAAAIILHFRWGKEYKPQFDGDYYRELPGDYTPAELGCLWNFGNIGANETSATILDLARKGLLIIETRITEQKRLGGLLGTKTSTEYVLKRTDANISELNNHEILLLDYFFDKVSQTGDTMSFQHLKDFAKSNPTSMQSFMSNFKTKVKTSEASYGFFDHDTERIRTWQIASGVFVMMGGAALTIFSGNALGLLATVGGIILLVSGVLLKRRSPMGSTHLAMWKAFRRFLLDFSSLDRAEIPSLIIWEHYLVYATVLGVAKQVLNQLKIVYPEITQPRTGMYHGWAWMHLYGPSSASNQLSGADLISGITDSLHTSVSAAINYRPSSGTGAGGGFAGGMGGGGGGGGGGRAG